MSLCNYLQSCSIDTQRNKTCIACTNFELHINDQGNGINILFYRSYRLAIKIINTFLFLQCTVTSITTVLIKGFHYSSNTLIYFFSWNYIMIIWLSWSDYSISSAPQQNSALNPGCTNVSGSPLARFCILIKILVTFVSNVAMRQFFYPVRIGTL